MQAVMINFRVTQRMLLALVLAVFVLVGSVWFGPYSSAAAQESASLSAADRLTCQTAIEEVYWQYRSWPEVNPAPKPALAEVMPAAAIQRKVDEALAQSAALDVYWQQPITGEMLQAEMERIATQTRQPGVIAGIYAALDHDPALVAECLARPVLARRLLHNWFAQDERFAGLDFADWWAAARRDMLETLDAPAFPYQLPPISAASGENDAWQDTASIPLDDIYGDLGGASVWTGVEMIFIGDFDVEAYRYNPATDSWQTATTIGSPPGLRDVSAVWTGSEMITWGGCTANNHNCTVSNGYRYNPLTDTWTTTAFAPISRTDHNAVWTGSEMLVWGGCTYMNDSCQVYSQQGARYNPVTDNWQLMSTSGAPTGRTFPNLLWTGSEMLVWGGFSSANGGRYNPTTNSWSPMSTANAPVATLSSAVWSGSEMIAWGGCTGSPECNTPHNSGARYNPTNNAWTPISVTNAPAARYWHQAVWIGSEMVVWGGYDGSNYLNSGGRYNPATDSWTAMSSVNAPSGRITTQMLWADSLVLVWGGYGTTTMRSGARYNPATNSWTPISGADPDSFRTYHSAVWTGVEMVAWGGVGDGTANDGLNTGRIFDQATNSWSAITTNGAPRGTWNASAVWTGSEMIVWGGQDGTDVPDSGGRYNPMSDSWSAVTPHEGRTQNAYVWTGTEMIVWGGSTLSQIWSNTGARYNPTNNSWTNISAAGAPSGRTSPAFVWTGTEMIVWGGSGSTGEVGSGGRYNPTANAWTPVSSLNAPQARSLTTAVWTGSEMIIWGGAADISPFIPLNTGARYNPAADSWTATSTVNAPVPVARHSAVWSGNEMIVWTGSCDSDEPDCYISNSYQGGRYNPIADSWTPTTLAGVPEPREWHSTVWTGTEMIVWGGIGERSGYRHTGGIYQVSLDPAFTLTAQPLARSVCVGGRTAYGLSVNGLGGFADLVALSVSGAPAGTFFYPANQILPPGQASLFVQSGAVAGDYTLEITGFAAGATPPSRTVSVDLMVQDAAPGAPTLVSPANGQTGLPLTPTFTWLAAAGADRYLVVLLTANGVVDYAVTDQTSHTFAAPLQPLTNYFWSVRPLNACGSGAFVAPAFFQTEAIADVLLVDDDDNTPDVRGSYTAALDALGVSYDVWDTANSDDEPDANTLGLYQAVIWFTGVEFGGFAGPGAAGEAALSAYLDGGGCFFISAQDYVYDRGVTPFMQTYLGVGLTESDIGQISVTGQGVYAGLGPYTLAYPFANYSDRISPTPPAIVAFMGNAGSAAISKTDTYHATFWGFPWEALPVAGRQAALSATLDWCAGG